MTTAGQPTSSQMLDRLVKETDLVVGLLQEGARGLDTVHDRLRHLTVHGVSEEQRFSKESRDHSFDSNTLMITCCIPILS
jgi:hypothetical protein